MNSVPTLYDLDETAEMLRVSPTFLRSEVQAGNIRHMRFGSRKYIRFTEDQIKDYLIRKEQEATEGAEDEKQAE